MTIFTFETFYRVFEHAEKFAVTIVAVEEIGHASHLVRHHVAPATVIFFKRIVRVVFVVRDRFGRKVEVTETVEQDGVVVLDK